MTWYIGGFVATLFVIGIFKKEEGPFWTRAILMQCAAGGLVAYLVSLGLSAGEARYGTDYASCVRTVVQETSSEAAARRLVYGCRMYHEGNRDLGRCLIDGLRKVQDDYAAKAVAETCHREHAPKSYQRMPNPLE